MRWWLHALVLLAVISGFGVSFALLSTVIGISSPWLALLLMFYFLGIAKFAVPLFILRMPRALYRLRPWEQDADVQRRLGVLQFGSLLRQTPFRHMNSGVFLGQGRSDPAKVRLQAESSEANHFWAAVLFMPYIVFAAASGMWAIAAWFMMAQVLVNVYPILHLRHIRGRLDRAIRKLSAARSA